MMKVLFIATCVVALVSCGSESKQENAQKSAPQEDPELVALGQEIFFDRAFGEADLACIDCHADHSDSLKAGDRLRAGHSILGAAHRTQTWNGEFTGEMLRRTAAGAAKCASLFQLRSEDPMHALNEREAAGLMAYYRSISNGTESRTLKWTAVSHPDDTARSKKELMNVLKYIDDLRGDVGRGEMLFGKACAICHGPSGRGNGPSMKVLRKHLDEVPLYVRRGSEGMPFFATDRITDQDIADIRQYIASSR